MKIEDIYKPVISQLETVERKLAELPQVKDPAVADTLREALGAGGKRLRPALVLIAAKTCAYTGERAIRIAVVVELIHTASLVHDDVLDNSDLRRGMPSGNVRWGNRMSILLGDHLYAAAVKKMTEDENVEILRSVATAVGEMTEGEIAQTLSRNDMEVTEEKYFSIIAGKTASLLSCSCRVGALLGTVRNGEVEILSDYGRNLGMAFQITDDLLDITGREDRLGKPLGNDIREGRLTLPLIHTLNVAGKSDREWVKQNFGQGRLDGKSFARMRDIVAGCGGIEYSLKKAEEFGRTCKQGLLSLEESACRDSLTLLADHVVARVS